METSTNIEGLYINSSCRTCLKNIDGIHIHCSYDIFSIPSLAEHLSVCSSLPVEPGDGFPTNLCESCHSKIEEFYNFQQMCISSKARFEEYINLETNPCPMEISSTNVMDFLLLTEPKKEIEDEDSIATDLHAEPPIAIQEEVETALNDEADENISNNANLENIKPRKKNYRFECETCNKYFINRKNFQEHNMRMHRAVKKFPCSMCYKSYTEKRGLNNHMKTKHKKKFRTNERITGESDNKNKFIKVNGKYNCPHCGVGCYYISALNRHIRSVHEGIKDFPCSHCDKAFASSSGMKFHEMIHTGERPHECNICGKKFIRITALKYHQRVHLKKSLKATK